MNLCFDEWANFFNFVIFFVHTHCHLNGNDVVDDDDDETFNKMELAERKNEHRNIYGKWIKMKQQQN